jgi:transcriptional regulator with XRE-family HTH domain
MAIDAAALGTRITQLRELRGLSIGALAEAAGGMAKSYLAKLERGEVENPGLKTLSAIARALDVTVADLVARAEPARGSEGEALLAEQADLERLMASWPPGLGDFLRQMADDGRPVPAGTVRALALAEFRGRRPERPEDWRFLYDALVRSVRST